MTIAKIPKRKIKWNCQYSYKSKKNIVVLVSNRRKVLESDILHESWSMNLKKLLLLLM